MGNINNDTKLVLARWIKFLVPEAMTADEKRKTAQRAGISHETLRKSVQRRSLNSDTLIRLSLARGISVRSLLDLPQTERSAMSKGEVIWADIGVELSEEEKVEFAEIVRFLRDRFRRMSD